MTDPGFRLTQRTEHFQGRIFSAYTDKVAMPDGAITERDYVRHVGAVAVVAVDDERRVALVRQYRYPVGEVLWELPAGLVEPGEDRRSAGARELAEETGLAASDWSSLISIYSSPGYSDERIEIFLARGLAPIGEEFTFERAFEEAHMTLDMVPLDEAAAMVDRGEILNGVAVAGILAAWHRLHA
jgi:ADP-ribose pyrophosphatase